MQGVDGWLTAKGTFCTLYIKDTVDLKALNSKIDTYQVDYGLLARPVLLIRKPEDEVLYKFDLIFMKVEELLDMRPAGAHVDVKIYKTQNDLCKVYVEIFNEGMWYVSFYVYKLNTIFGCEEKITADIIAHEMAHSVIDHHFTVMPPRKIGEMLAHYVELNLREKE